MFGVLPGVGNITVNPLFQAPAPLPQPSTEFFPSALPVIDACVGNGSDHDLFASLRPIGLRLDMGAYEQ